STGTPRNGSLIDRCGASEFLPLGEFGLKVAEPLTDPVDGVPAEDKAKRRTSGRHGGEDRPGRLGRGLQAGNLLPSRRRRGSVPPFRRTPAGERRSKQRPCRTIPSGRPPAQRSGSGRQEPPD